MAVQTSERGDRSEVFHPSHTSRINSVSSQFSDGPMQSPSARSSISSWSEEPTQTNMDISTGHMILVNSLICLREHWTENIKHSDFYYSNSPFTASFIAVIIRKYINTLYRYPNMCLFFCLYLFVLPSPLSLISHWFQILGLFLLGNGLQGSMDSGFSDTMDCFNFTLTFVLFISAQLRQERLIGAW